MFLFFSSALFLSLCLANCQLIDLDFNPIISATCTAGAMNIRINFNKNFTGAVHARDYRTSSCMVLGDGSNQAKLSIDLLASEDSNQYCGVLVNNKTDERSLPIAVRIHKTLELADDKFYVITCGKAGFKNTKDEISIVTIKLFEDGKRVSETVYGRPYTLRAEISRPDETHSIRVKSCIAFDRFNNSVQLIDDRGCPINENVITQFEYKEETNYAEAILKSMFRFPKSSEVHFQCNVAVCKGDCSNEFNCDRKSIIRERLSKSSNEEGSLMASTTTFVLDPNEAPQIGESCEEYGFMKPSWLLYLCITLGVLFLTMLIINIFLCSALTCACGRTEIIEKDPSIIDEYDPYRSWHGSQYGSRYSLSPNHKHGYNSGGSTMNSGSDHYAIVHSRPGSRYGNYHKHHGPSSNISSQYNHK